MAETDIDSYCFEELDIELGGDLDNVAYCSVQEIQGITLACDNQKQEVCKDCKDGLGLLKTECEGEEIIESDEDENFETKQSQTILKGNIEDDGSIKFLINGEAFLFNPNNTKENGIGYNKDFAKLKETTIIADKGNFVIKDGFIYDWDKSMTSYKNKIDNMGKGISHSIYLDILNRLEPSPIGTFTLQNYQKNIHIFECILALEESRQSLDVGMKHELLLRSAEHLNRTFEDKVWANDLDSEELEKVIDDKLIGILERGVFVG